MKNYKFLTSNNQNNLINFNESYASSIKSFFTFLNEDFYKTADPMIAGSFILRNVFSRNSPYEDIDFYFKSEHQKNIANDFFQKICVSSKGTKFATTYLVGTRLKLQVIKQTYSTPVELISSFDITPSMICFEPKNESFTYEIGCLYSWYRKTITLNRSPLFGFFPLTNSTYLDAFLYLNLLLRRISKYSNRYSFKPSPSLLNRLASLSRELISYTKNKNITYTYYITDSSGEKQKIKVDSSNVDSYFNSLLAWKNEKKDLLLR